MSPAVDVEFRLPAEIDPHGLNRASCQSITAGGKGINVSRSVKKCAEEDGGASMIEGDLITIAPIGGAVGELLSSALENEGIKLTATQIDGSTRLNASVIPAQGKSQEINAPGTPIGDALLALEDAVLSSIEEGDTVVIAGSCPKDVDASYPAKLIREIKKRGGYTVLDCDGAALKYAVTGERSGRPDLIKPNTDELGELTGKTIADEEDVFRAAEELGDITVITTMAGDGAVLTSCGKSEFFPVKKRPVVRLKGAGDTFLGAFVYHYRYKGLSARDAMIAANEIAGKYVAGE